MIGAKIDSRHKSYAYYLPNSQVNYARKKFIFWKVKLKCHLIKKEVPNRTLCICKVRSMRMNDLSINGELQEKGEREADLLHC